MGAGFQTGGTLSATEPYPMVCFSYPTFNDQDTINPTVQKGIRAVVFIYQY